MCLTRGNAVAREASGRRKAAGYAGNATLHCDAHNLAAHWALAQARLDAFRSACADLGARVRTLWVPYEAGPEKGDFNVPSTRVFSDHMLR